MNAPLLSLAVIGGKRLGECVLECVKAKGNVQWNMKPPAMSYEMCKVAMEQNVCTVFCAI